MDGNKKTFTVSSLLQTKRRRPETAACQISAFDLAKTKTVKKHLYLAVLCQITCGAPFDQE